MKHQSTDASENPGHEPGEPRMLPIVVSFAGLLGLIALALAVVAFMLGLFSATHEGNMREVDARKTINPPPPVPILDPHQADDLQHLRDRERKLLSQYKWIDQKSGIARIPIGRAIDILAAQAASPARQQDLRGASHE